MAPIIKGLGGPYLTQTGATILDSNTAQQYKNANIGFVRILFGMPSRYASQKWDKGLLESYQNVVGYFHEKLGIRTIGLLDSTLVPKSTQQDWNSTDARFSAFQTAYAENAKTIIEGMPEVKEWEIWNEPNSYAHNTRGHFFGGTYIRPDRFSTIMHTTTPLMQATKAVAITGGLFMHNMHGELSLGSSGAGYLDQFLGQYKRPVDFYAIGIHPYLDEPGQFAEEHFATQLQFYKQVMSKHKCPLNLWITEFGWSVGAVTKAEQAENIQKLFTFSQDYGKIPVIVYFELQDSPLSSLFYGLVSAQGDIRPAYSVFKQLPTA